MKHLLHIVLWALSVWFACTVQAQEAEHYFVLWNEGSASFVFPTDQQTGTQIGAGGGLGVGYELNFNHFILQTGAYAHAAQERLNQQPNSCTCVYLQAPLLFGGEFGHLYFLTGAKFNVNVFTTEQQPSSADFNANTFPTGQLPEDDRLRFDVLAGAEIGLNWNLQQFRYTKPKIRVALFVDYGFPDNRLLSGIKLSFLFGGKAHDCLACPRCRDHPPFR